MITSGCAVELEQDLELIDYSELWFLQNNIDDFVPEYLDFEFEQNE